MSCDYSHGQAAKAVEQAGVPQTQTMAVGAMPGGAVAGGPGRWQCPKCGQFGNAALHVCPSQITVKSGQFEIAFDGRQPSDDLMNAMTAAGFRFHRQKRVWFAAQNEKAQRFVETLQATPARTRASTGVPAPPALASPPPASPVAKPPAPTAPLDLRLVDYIRAKRSPQFDRHPKWDERVEDTGLWRQGEAGAAAYLRRYGRNIGLAKLVNLANQAEGRGYHDFARGFWKAVYGMDALVERSPAEQVPPPAPPPSPTPQLAGAERASSPAPKPPTIAPPRKPKPRRLMLGDDDNTALAGMFGNIATLAAGKPMQVQFTRGGQARTTGSVTDLQGFIKINLPNLADTRGAEQQARELAVRKADVLHEAAHDLFTDPGIVARVRREARAMGNSSMGLSRGRLFESVYGLLEDGRVERELIRAKPALARALAVGERLRPRWTDDDTAGTLGETLAAMLYTALPYRGVGEDVRARMSFAPGLMFDELRPIVERAVNGSGEDVYAAAMQITERLERSTLSENTRQVLLTALPDVPSNTPIKPPPEPGDEDIPADGDGQPQRKQGKPEPMAGQEEDESEGDQSEEGEPSQRQSPRGRGQPMDTGDGEGEPEGEGGETPVSRVELTDGDERGIEEAVGDEGDELEGEDAESAAAGDQGEAEGDEPEGEDGETPAGRVELTAGRSDERDAEDGETDDDEGGEAKVEIEVISPDGEASNQPDDEASVTMAGREGGVTEFDGIPELRDLSDDEVRADLDALEEQIVEEVRRMARRAATYDALGERLHAPLPRAQAGDCVGAAVAGNTIEQQYRDADGRVQTVTVNVHNASRLVRQEKRKALAERRDRNRPVALRIAAELEQIREETRARHRFQDEGMLDSSRWVDVLYGEAEDVHIRDSRTDEVSFAVSLAVDMSGSMQDEIEDGRLFDAATTLGDTFEQLDIPYEVRGFGSRRNMIQLKSIGDTRQDVDQMTLLAHLNLGGTLMDETANLAVTSLMACPQRNRLFVSLTDGQLDDAGDTNRTTKAARELEGMIVFGVYLTKGGPPNGYEIENLDRLYGGRQNWAAIGSLKELPEKVGARIARLYREM